MPSKEKTTEWSVDPVAAARWNEIEDDVINQLNQMHSSWMSLRHCVQRECNKELQAFESRLRARLGQTYKQMQADQEAVAAQPGTAAELASLAAHSAQLRVLLLNEVKGAVGLALHGCCIQRCGGDLSTYLYEATVATQAVSAMLRKHGVNERDHVYDDRTVRGELKAFHAAAERPYESVVRLRLLRNFMWRLCGVYLENERPFFALDPGPPPPKARRSMGRKAPTKK